MMEKIGLSWEFIFIRLILPFKKSAASRLSRPDIEHFMIHAAAEITRTDTALGEWFTLWEEIQLL